ncbi:MAG: putative sulfate exporter family transporter [Tissierellia bacterium]|nr:putative sulfate exporter family transporter [Tissierellia bacterium]
MEKTIASVKTQSKDLDRVHKKKPFWASSDLVAILIALSLVALNLGFWYVKGEAFRAIKYPAWEGLDGLMGLVFREDFYFLFFLTGLALSLVFSAGQSLSSPGSLKTFLPAFVGLYFLASLVYLLSSQATFKEYLEYAFWALLIGLLGNNLLGLHKYLAPALKSGFYVKVGLVLMGAEVLFSNIASFGAYGIAISWVVVPIVIVFMWWFGIHYLKMDSPTMVMVLAVTTSVCGVSAAVAAAASIKANKEDLTFSVGISIFFTIVMMVLMPLFVKWVGFSELIGGAWIGNTVDSTGAVVLAGEALGPLASQVAAMIKMIQNVLIGFVAFILALFFAKREGGQKPGDKSEIWARMPKFIFGFIGMSLLFSFIIQPGLGVEVTNELISGLGTWKGWCFCLTFLCIGLETNFRDMVGKLESGKPVTLYVVGQTFSLILSLLVCWIVLGGHFFALPHLGI